MNSSFSIVANICHLIHSGVRSSEAVSSKGRMVSRWAGAASSGDVPAFSCPRATPGPGPERAARLGSGPAIVAAAAGETAGILELLRRAGDGHAENGRDISRRNDDLEQARHYHPRAGAIVVGQPQGGAAGAKRS
jgi:hypothetical protein